MFLLIYLGTHGVSAKRRLFFVLLATFFLGHRRHRAGLSRYE
jgi:hypothetical protein